MCLLKLSLLKYSLYLAPDSRYTTLYLLCAGNTIHTKNNNGYYAPKEVTMYILKNKKCPKIYHNTINKSSIKGEFDAIKYLQTYCYYQNPLQMFGN